MTPLDKLASLPNAQRFLRQGITLSDLHQQAKQQTDVQAANAVQQARNALFKTAARRSAVFGNIRHNKRLNRFTLRGRHKVDGQWKLFALVHNIEKWANLRKVA